MKHGSLFSGIGGFDLAAEWMGWENVFHCEINEFCNKILNHYWPDAKGYTDITKTDFTEWKGKVDIISGGFPCQPYSISGKRKGKQDNRHLWPEMLRAIREIQPVWVVGENVSGLLNWQRGMVLAEIKTDLEAEGFEVFPPCVLPACSKNAPHKRDRLWIIAHSVSRRKRELQTTFTREETKEIGCKNSCGPESIISNGNASDAPNSRFNNEFETRVQQERKTFSRKFIGSDNDEIRTWSNFPTQPPLCGRNDGVPNRVDRIKALGNAIVPQVAYEIFKAIETIK